MVAVRREPSKNQSKCKTDALRRKANKTSEGPIERRPVREGFKFSIAPKRAQSGECTALLRLASLQFAKIDFTAQAQLKLCVRVMQSCQPEQGPDE